MASSDGRGDARYKAANAKLKRTATPICRWCWSTIDLDLVWPDPWCWTADHVIPLALGGDLHGERVPMHARCNESRGIKPLPPEPIDVSTEDW